MPDEKIPTSNAMERTKQVDVTDVVKSAEKAMKFEEKAEESGKPIWTKKKKIHRRKAKKQAREIIEQSKGKEL